MLHVVSLGTKMNQAKKDQPYTNETRTKSKEEKRNQILNNRRWRG